MKLNYNEITNNCQYSLQVIDKHEDVVSRNAVQVID